MTPRAHPLCAASGGLTLAGGISTPVRRNAQLFEYGGKRKTRLNAPTIGNQRPSRMAGFLVRIASFSASSSSGRPLTQLTGSLRNMGAG